MNKLKRLLNTSLLSNKHKQYILKNQEGGDTDSPIEKGSGENSIQQKGTGASSLSVASFAEGAETLAGGKGYKWTRLIAAIGTNFVRGVLLNEEPKGWHKNDIVSIKNGNIYSNIGIIGDIFNSDSLGGWVVQFKSTLSITTDIVEDTSEDAQTIWVSKSPTAGNIDLAKATHAEGQGTVASRDCAHAEGKDTGAYSKYAHAEGYKTEAYHSAHAEGYMTIALGNSSHAEGNHTNANGINSHAEGSNTRANGTNAHAEGYETIAQNQAEHAQGQYNKSTKTSDTYDNAGNTAFSHGIGTSANDRKNAFEIMQNGDIYVVGLGGYDGTNAGQEGILTLQQFLTPIMINGDERDMVDSDTFTIAVDAFYNGRTVMLHKETGEEEVMLGTDISTLYGKTIILTN